MSARFLTTAEAAEVIRETAENVARRCKAGQIRASRLGGEWRIREDDLLDFMTRAENPSVRVRSSAGRRRSA